MPIRHKTLKIFTNWPWLRKIDSQLIIRNLMCKDSAKRLVHSFCVNSSSQPFPKGQFCVLIVRLELAYDEGSCGRNKFASEKIPPALVCSRWQPFSHEYREVDSEKMDLCTT